MGVLGLSTFAQQNCDLLSEVVNLTAAAKEQVEALTVLVDLNGIMFQLCEEYEDQYAESRLGVPPMFANVFSADPEFYVEAVVSFLERLRSNGVYCVLYVDGPLAAESGSAAKKEATALARGQNSISTVSRIYDLLLKKSPAPPGSKLRQQLMIPFSSQSSLLEERLDALGFELITCEGEADPVMGRDLLKRNAFAILGVDSDFMIMRGARYIPFDSLTFTNQGVTGRLYTVSKLSAMLQLPEERLVDFAALCGNDASLPFLQKYQIHQVLSIEKGDVGYTAQFLRSVPDFSIKNIPFVSGVLSKDVTFESALDYAAEFYGFASPSPTTVQEPSLLSQPESSLPSLRLSTNARTVRANGQIWLRNEMFPVLSSGHHSQIVHFLLPSWRITLGMSGVAEGEFIYRCGKRFGKHKYSALAGAPRFEEVFRMSLDERLDLLHRILFLRCSLSADSISCPAVFVCRPSDDWISKIPLLNAKSAPSELRLRSWFAVTLLRYILSFNVYSGTYAALPRIAISETEFEVMITYHIMLSFVKYSSFDAILKCKDVLAAEGTSLLQETSGDQLCRSMALFQALRMITSDLTSWCKCLDVPDGCVNSIIECGAPLNSGLLFAYLLTARLKSFDTMLQCVRAMLSVTTIDDMDFITAATQVRSMCLLPFQEMRIDPFEAALGVQEASVFSHGDVDASLLEDPALQPVIVTSEADLPDEPALDTTAVADDDVDETDILASNLVEKLQNLDDGDFPTMEEMLARQQPPSQPAAAHSERLPIHDHEQHIMSEISKRRLTCIQGETGCGKSTMVPLFILRSGNYDYQQPHGDDSHKVRVVVTQPRRIAAVSLARRVATLIGDQVGETVGYRIGNDSRRSRKTRLEFMTTGYLLTWLANNPEQLYMYSHVVLDEVHERQIDSDFLALIIKLLLVEQDARRAVLKSDKKKWWSFGMPEETKLVVMSATIQAELFIRYFSPIERNTLLLQPEPIFVGAKRFPVREYYLDDLSSLLSASSSAKKQLQLVRQVFKDGDCPGADYFSDRVLELIVHSIMRFHELQSCVLVFLPGSHAIDRVEELMSTLMSAEMVAHTQTFVMHSMCTDDAQELALVPAGPSYCKIVLSTNIAETSLTIPDVKVVIDSGLRRDVEYDANLGTSMLGTRWVSKAAAKQRLGRAGRVSPGICVRMFPLQFFEQMLEPHDPPEVLRVPLERVVLQTKSHLSVFGNVFSVIRQFVQPPSSQALHSAVRRLEQTGAIRRLGPDNTGVMDDEVEFDFVITNIGHVATALSQLGADILAARLVALGLAADLLIDVVVLVCVALIKDIFLLPHPMAQRDKVLYTSDVIQNFFSRYWYDGGTQSDLLAAWALYWSWLSSPRRDRDWASTHGASLMRLRAVDFAVSQACRAIAGFSPRLPDSVLQALSKMERVASVSTQLRRRDVVSSDKQEGVVMRLKYLVIMSHSCSYLFRGFAKQASSTGMALMKGEDNPDVAARWMVLKNIPPEFAEKQTELASILCKYANGKIEKMLFNAREKSAAILWERRAGQIGELSDTCAEIKALVALSKDGKCKIPKPVEGKQDGDPKEDFAIGVVQVERRVEWKWLQNGSLQPKFNWRSGLGCITDVSSRFATSPSWYAVGCDVIVLKTQGQRLLALVDKATVLDKYPPGVAELLLLSTIARHTESAVVVEAADVEESAEEDAPKTAVEIRRVQSPTMVKVLMDVDGMMHALRTQADVFSLPRPVLLSEWLTDVNAVRTQLSRVWDGSDGSSLPVGTLFVAMDAYLQKYVNKLKAADRNWDDSDSDPENDLGSQNSRRKGKKPEKAQKEWVDLGWDEPQGVATAYFPCMKIAELPPKPSKKGGRDATPREASTIVAELLSMPLSSEADCLVCLKSVFRHLSVHQPLIPLNGATEASFAKGMWASMGRLNVAKRDTNRRSRLIRDLLSVMDPSEAVLSMQYVMVAKTVLCQRVSITSVDKSVVVMKPSKHSLYQQSKPEHWGRVLFLALFGMSGLTKVSETELPNVVDHIGPLSPQLLKQCRLVFRVYGSTEHRLAFLILLIGPHHLVLSASVIQAKQKLSEIHAELLQGCSRYLKYFRSKLAPKLNEAGSMDRLDVVEGDMESIAVTSGIAWLEDRPRLVHGACDGGDSADDAEDDVPDREDSASAALTSSPGNASPQTEVDQAQSVEPTPPVAAASALRAPLLSDADCLAELSSVHDKLRREQPNHRMAKAGSTHFANTVFASVSFFDLSPNDSPRRGRLMSAFCSLCPSITIQVTRVGDALRCHRFIVRTATSLDAQVFLVATKLQPLPAADLPGYMKSMWLVTFLHYATQQAEAALSASTVKQWCEKLKYASDLPPMRLIRRDWLWVNEAIRVRVIYLVVGQSEVIVACVRLKNGEKDSAVERQLLRMFLDNLEVAKPNLPMMLTQVGQSVKLELEEVVAKEGVRYSPVA